MDIVRYILVAFSILCLILTGARAEDGFVRDRAYSIGELAPVVDDASWKPFQGILRLGYGEEPVWIKLRVAPLSGQDPDDPIRVNVQPGYLDQIELFDPLLSKEVSNPVGDHFPITNNAIRGLTYNFILAAGDRPRTIYVKVKTSSSRLIEITAGPSAEIQVLALHDYLYSASLLVIAFLLFGGALYNLLTIRDAIAIKFTILQMIFFFYGFFILGFARIFLFEVLPASVMDACTNFLIITFTALCVLFYIGLLSEYFLSRRCCRLIMWIAGVVIGFELVIYLWKPSISLMVNSYLAVFSSCVFLCLSAYAVVSNSSARQMFLPSPKVLLFYFVLLNFVNISNFSQFLGFNSSFGQIIYGPIWNGVFSGCFLLFIMHFRGANLKRMQIKENQEKSMQLMSEEQKVEVLGQYIDLIAHEVRTPLSMISLALDGEVPNSRLHELAMHGVGEIQELLVRCSLLGDLNSGDVSLILEAFNPKDLVANLIAVMPEPSRFELYCGELGFAKADVVLLRVVIGNLLENAIKYGANGDLVRVVIHDDQKLSRFSIEVTNKIGSAGTPDLNKLFERRYRAPMANRKTGLGLGLYLSKKLMKLQGGDLQCDVAGDYIRFCATIPMELIEND